MRTTGSGPILALAVVSGLLVGGSRFVLPFGGPSAGKLVLVPPSIEGREAAAGDSRAVSADERARSALDDQARVLALLLALGAAGAMSAVLLSGPRSGPSGDHAWAVRAAVGAMPHQLSRWAARLRARELWMGGLGGGALAVGAAAVLKQSWTGETLRGGALATTLTSAGLTLLPWVLAVSLTGVGALIYGRRTRLADRLRRGRSVTNDRATLRSGDFAAVGQITVASGALTLAVLLLTQGPDFGAGPRGAALPASEESQVVRVQFVAGSWTESERGALFANLAHEPGVIAATPGAFWGVGTVRTLMAQCGRCSLGGLPAPLQPERTQQHAVSGHFFADTGVELSRGRVFSDTDTASSTRVAIVNESFARRRFEGGDPLGKAVQVGGAGGSWHTVVGVVRDVEALGLAGGGRQDSVLYLPAAQVPPETVDLVTNSAALGTDLLDRLAQLGPLTVLSDSEPLSSLRARHAGPAIWISRVFILLGVLTGLTALQSLESALRSSFRRRRREFAIRLALGGRPWSIVRLALERTLGLAGVGIGLGALLAMWVASVLDRSLGGLDPLSPGPYLFTALGLGAFAIVVAVVPARAAARTDPGLALTLD